MVRDNRIKTYRFADADLTANAGGVIDIYSEHPLNGEMLAIQVEGNTYTATGSVWLYVSGTNENLWYMKSGTATSNIAAGDTYFPRAYTRVAEANTLISGTTGPIEKIPLNSILNFIGSGLGNGTSGVGLNIVYQ